MVYRGLCLHRLGKAGMNGVTRLLRTIPQLPDAKVPEIFPENTNAELLQILKQLCIMLGNIRYCGWAQISAEILGKFFGGILEADAE